MAVQGRVTVAPFENTLVGRVYDGSGREVGRGPITVTAPDMGQPGTFSGSIPFSVSGFTPGRVEIEDVNASGGPPFATAAVQVNLDTLGPAWLDQAAPVNWNGPRNPLPVAPPPPSAAPPDPRCLETLRPPETAEDQQVSAAGWGLVGQFTGGWGLRIVTGQSGFDGMCRPLSYQVFVFSGGTYAGTMSPGPMDSRTDGAWQQALIFTAGSPSPPPSPATASKIPCAAPRDRPWSPTTSTAAGWRRCWWPEYGHDVPGAGVAIGGPPGSPLRTRAATSRAARGRPTRCAWRRIRASRASAATR